MAILSSRCQHGFRIYRDDQITLAMRSRSGVGDHGHDHNIMESD